MKTLWTLCLASLAALSQAAAPLPTPQTLASPAPATAPAAQASPVATAEASPVTSPVAPAQPSAAAPQGLSQAAEAPAPDPPSLPEVPADLAAPEGVSDGAGTDDAALSADMLDVLAQATGAAVLDLHSLSSTSLVKMVQGVDKETQSFAYDSAADVVLAPGAETPTARSVDVNGLLAELGKRLAYDNDPLAKQAFELLALRGDLRGAAAKAEAFADKLADSLVARSAKGDAKAKADLERLAKEGNHRARQYLGLESLPPPPMPVQALAAAPAAQAVSNAAQAEALSLSPTAAPLSPSQPAPVSVPAASAPATPNAPVPQSGTAKP